MQEYSDHPEQEFKELYRRANSGDKIKIIMQRGDDELYTITGTVVGIAHSILKINNPVLDLKKIKDKSFGDYLCMMNKKSAHVSLGDYVRNYEFLTGEKFTIEQQKKERKRYYDDIEERNYFDYSTSF